MEVEITSLDHQGRGIGRINNKIIFIPNTLPGEIVQIKITSEKKKYMEGIVTDFVQTSPERVFNLCPYYPKCGGCQLLHLPYQNQLQYKMNKIINIFQRYNLDKVKINNIVGSPNNFNYRNKATFHCHNNTLGYYEENSKKFIGIDNCLLLNQKINDAIDNLPLDKEKIVIRTNNNEVIHDNDKKIIHTIVDYKFFVSINSFFQINDYVTPLLYNKVKDYLKNNNYNTVLDLYCGTGTIGIFISDVVTKVIGIEINQSAINDAIENSKLNNINNIEFICGDAGIASKKLNIKPDAIIVDPPRAGLNNETIQTILNFNPKTIIYVSCDPMTLVRDLNILKDTYEIIEVTPFDMFPNTYHVENVCLLSKK